MGYNLSPSCRNTCGDFFSVVDIIQVLTDSVDGHKYWNKLKQRLNEEGNETVTNCHQLKLPAADGKKRLTDVADADALCSIEIQISKNNPRYRRWFTTALVVEVVACLGWNWFKL